MNAPANPKRMFRKIENSGGLEGFQRQFGGTQKIVSYVRFHIECLLGEVVVLEVLVGSTELSLLSDIDLDLVGDWAIFSSLYS